MKVYLTSEVLEFENQSHPDPSKRVKVEELLKRAGTNMLKQQGILKSVRSSLCKEDYSHWMLFM
jgi:hypothetical protein